MADAVQAHMVECEECLRTVLDYADFPDLDPPSASDRLSAAEVEERWRSLEREVEGRNQGRRCRLGSVEGGPCRGGDQKSKESA